MTRAVPLACTSNRRPAFVSSASEVVRDGQEFVGYLQCLALDLEGGMGGLGQDLDVVDGQAEPGQDLQIDSST